MTKLALAPVLAVGAWFGAIHAVPTSPDPIVGDQPNSTVSVAPDTTLATKLTAGGYAIICRHTATDHTATDRGPDRASQRNLTAEGERQARVIGEAIRRLGIPIGEVRANPMYRNQQTAELAFGYMEVDSTLAGGNAFAVVRSLASAAVPAGTNRALVTRIGILTAAFEGHGVRRIQEGDCLIAEPGDDGSFAVVAHLAPGDWQQLR